MNGAPTGGFEKDVGNRTDVRILGHSNIRFNPLKNDTKYIHNLFSTEIDGNPSLVVIPWLYNMTGINKTKDASFRAAKRLSKQFSDVQFYISTPESIAASEAIFQLELGVSR